MTIVILAIHVEGVMVIRCCGWRVAVAIGLAVAILLGIEENIDCFHNRHLLRIPRRGMVWVGAVQRLDALIWIADRSTLKCHDSSVKVVTAYRLVMHNAARHWWRRRRCWIAS